MVGMAAWQIDKIDPTIAAFLRAATCGERWQGRVQYSLDNVWPRPRAPNYSAFRHAAASTDTTITSH